MLNLFHTKDFNKITEKLLVKLFLSSFFMFLTACASTPGTNPVDLMNERFNVAKPMGFPSDEKTAAPDQFFKQCYETGKGDHLSKTSYFCK